MNNYLLTVALACGLAFSACSRQPLTMPQPGAVQGSLSRTGSSISEAQAQQAEISRKAAEARYLQQRADNKQVVIDAGRKWKAEHPKK